MLIEPTPRESWLAFTVLGVAQRITSLMQHSIHTPHYVGEVRLVVITSCIQLLLYPRWPYGPVWLLPTSLADSSATAMVAAVLLLFRVRVVVIARRAALIIVLLVAPGVVVAWVILIA